MLAIVRVWLAWLATSWMEFCRWIWLFLPGLRSALGSSSTAAVPGQRMRLDRAKWLHPISALAAAGALGVS